MSEWIKVTDYGQLKKGMRIRFKSGDSIIDTTVKDVLLEGTGSAAILYNRKQNHYFILSMYFNGRSHAKELEYFATPTISIPIAEYEAMRLDTERWKGLVNLWLLSTELSLTQNEEGGYSIIQTEPVENEIFAPLEGDTPEQAISAAIKEGN